MTAEEAVVPTTRSGRRIGETKVLVALEGFCDPDRPCIPGELLRTRHWCGRRGCSCGSVLAGTASGGTASAARVVLLRAGRDALLDTLGSVIDPDEGGPWAARAAGERLLDTVARWGVGTLVRREDDVLVPFPPGARITGPRTISYRAADGR